LTRKEIIKMYNDGTPVKTIVDRYISTASSFDGVKEKNKNIASRYVLNVIVEGIRAEGKNYIVGFNRTGKRT